MQSMPDQSTTTSAPHTRPLPAVIRGLVWSSSPWRAAHGGAANDGEARPACADVPRVRAMKACSRPGRHACQPQARSQRSKAEPGSGNNAPYELRTSCHESIRGRVRLSMGSTCRAEWLAIAGNARGRRAKRPPSTERDVVATCQPLTGQRAPASAAGTDRRAAVSRRAARISSWYRSPCSSSLHHHARRG